MANLVLFREQIIEASVETDTEITFFDKTVATQFLNKVYKKFTRDGIRNRSLWDRPQLTRAESFSVYALDGWRWLDKFIGDAKCLLCLDEGIVVEFECGQDVVTVIGETSLPEFYVTNDALEYIVLINDHDYIIAFGETAITWLKSIK